MTTTPQPQQPDPSQPQPQPQPGIEPPPAEITDPQTDDDTTPDEPRRSRK